MTFCRIDRERRMRLAVGLIVLLVMFVGESRGWCQGLVRIELARSSPPVVPGRPMPTIWDLSVDGTAVLEGELELTIRFLDQVKSRVTIDDLAITGPTQQIRLVLPPVNEDSTIDQFEVDARFKTARDSYDLGMHVLRVPRVGFNTAMLAVIEGELDATTMKARSQLTTELSRERLYGSTEQSGLSTIGTTMRASDVGADPFWWCGFDGVVLLPDGLRDMKSAQLASLATWVRAGGRLVVFAGGQLGRSHLGWLNDLTAEADDGGEPLVADDRGRLVPLANERSLLEADFGWGRALVQTEQSSGDPDSRPLIPPVAVARWWGVSPMEYHELLQASDTIPDPALLSEADRSQSPPLIQQSSEMPIGVNWSMVGNPLSSLAVGHLTDFLLPDSLRLVPLWLLASILLVTVVAVGPGEWWVLGAIHRRRWTWITFPVSIVAVTAATLLVSDAYMATTDLRRELVVIDLDEAGEEVRTTRFEVLFPNRPGPIETDVAGGVTMAVKASPQPSYGGITFVAMANANGTTTIVPRPMNPTMGSDTPPVSIYNGRPPARYTLTQHLEQWTPQMNQVLSFPDRDDPPASRPRVKLADGLMWRDFLTNQTDGGLVASETGRMLVNEARRLHGATVAVAAVGPHGRMLTDGHGWWRMITDQQMAGRQTRRFFPGLANQNGLEVEGWPSIVRALTLANGHASVPGREGLSGLAPLASLNVDRWQLVLLDAQEGHWRIVREIHRFPADGVAPLDLRPPGQQIQRPGGRFLPQGPGQVQPVFTNP